MLPYQQRERDAEARLRAELAKPIDIYEVCDADDAFNPWSLFPAVYGSYSSDFDERAIDVLREILNQDKKRTDLGAEMFREMLCVADLCDYGTSPRVCFWACGIDKSLLPQLIGKWAGWSALRWYAQDAN